MDPIASRALVAIGYDRSARILRVRFRHGGLYDYFDVPPHVYEAMIASEHPWTEWGTHIKATYRFDRLE